MTEKLFTREMVEKINSAPGWEGFKAEKIQLSGPDAGQPVDVPPQARKGDDVPAVIVKYDPFCDCGEEKMMFRTEPPIKGFCLWGWGYADTCYECAVISSD